MSYFTIGLERHLSDMSEGGPVGSTAFKEEREMFSASNSTGPGFTWTTIDTSLPCCKYWVWTLQESQRTHQARVFLKDELLKHLFNRKGDNALLQLQVDYNFKFLTLVSYTKYIAFWSRCSSASGEIQINLFRLITLLLAFLPNDGDNISI